MVSKFAQRQLLYSEIRYQHILDKWVITILRKILNTYINVKLKF